MVHPIVDEKGSSNLTSLHLIDLNNCAKDATLAILSSVVLDRKCYVAKLHVATWCKDSTIWVKRRGFAFHSDRMFQYLRAKYWGSNQD